MSATLDRLRLLRTQAGVGARVAADAGPVAVPTSGPASTVTAFPTIAANTHVAAPFAASTPRTSPRTSAASIADLRRLLGIRARAIGHVIVPPGNPADRTLPGEELSPGLRRIETRYPWPDAPAALTVPDRDEPPLQSSRVLAFDTETTGLAGGTGTRAFMIGAADWIDGHVRVRQLCITTLGAETAMLREFASWLQADTVLVSYNGRSYDAPLLRTRCRLARLDDMLADRPHVDLLHPTRRRYRGVWENCRLATIERHLLGIVREDDLPGSQAPGAWLQYLRGGSAALLRRVHAHNDQDVRSLLLLLCRLGT